MHDKVKKLALGVAALSGAAVGGAAVAGAANSNSGTTTTPPALPQNMPTHGSAAHEDAEKAVTGDDAAKAQAAVVKAAGGGTAGDVTTDFTGNGYEVTVTKSDGSKVEYHLDSSFQVPQHPGGWGGPPPPSDSAN
jgi:tetrahydromethanopterin S-methyltransferase subunit E